MEDDIGVAKTQESCTVGARQKGNDTKDWLFFSSYAMELC